MLSIIVVFPKAEDGKSIKNVLIRFGYEVQAVCTSGAQAISLANELDEGIIICGYRYPDMHYLELYNYLPRAFQMLLIASPAKLEECMNTIHSIIESESCRVSVRSEFINSLKDGLKEYQ